MLGLVMFGLGIAFMVQGDLGLSPWDVLHEGVAERSGLAIGTVTIATGVVVLLLWLPLRERMGIGTVANALVIGLVVNAGIAVLPEPEHRSEEHTSELQSLMRISYAVFCLKKQKKKHTLK